MRQAMTVTKPVSTKLIFGSLVARMEVNENNELESVVVLRRLGAALLESPPFAR